MTTFTTSTAPATWGLAINHGRTLGVPAEQLDLVPHRSAQVEARFGAGALG